MRQSNVNAMIHLTVNFEKKNPVLPTEKFPFLALLRNAKMLQHLIIYVSCPLSVAWSLKTKENLKRFALKVVAFAYERWSLTKSSE